MGRIVNPFSTDGATARAEEKKGVPLWAGFVRERLDVEARGREQMEKFSVWRIYPPGTVIDVEELSKEVSELFPKRDPDVRWHQVLEIDLEKFRGMSRTDLARLKTAGGAFAMERRGDDWKIVAGGLRFVPVLALWDLGRQAARNPGRVKLFGILRSWVDGPEERDAPPAPSVPGVQVGGS